MANWKKSRIGVLYGGTTSERDVSLRTGKAVLTALVGRGYDCEAIDASRDLPRQLEEKKIEVAFVALHGKLGEDGSVQGLLEVMRIPYTHSGVLASSVAMDKIASKRMFEHAGLPTPAWTTFHGAPGTSFEAVDLPANVPVPFVVKPANAGSTIGITVVKDSDRHVYGSAIDAALPYDRALLVEQFVEGIEITVAVLDMPGTGATALPIVEIVPPEGFFDYEAKYTKGKTNYVCPARLDEATTAEAQRVAIEAHRILGCEGVTRSDFMVDRQGKAWLLETNTIPGMTETSLVPKAAAQAGMDFPALVETILDTARLKL